MTQYATFGRRLGRLLLLASLSGLASLRAQDPRDSLVAKALSEFEAEHRIRLLVAALDPALGPPGETWRTGVHLLAQTLLEEGQDSVAVVWLRWALRVSADFPLDTVRFLPQVATAYREANEFVRGTSTPDDTLLVTSWVWGAPEDQHEPGRIQVAAGSVPDSARVSVEGLGAVSPGVGTSAPPGSYALYATATGYDSVSVMREVMPGVTTVMKLRLHLSPAQALPPVAEAPVRSVAAPPHGKRFPWVLVALGTVGAGTLVAILAGGGSKPPPPTTGGIIIPFPFP